MIEMSDSDDGNNESLEYYFYIKKDYEICLSKIRLCLQMNSNNNRHYCNRNPKCFCISLGKMLLNICMSTKLNLYKEFSTLYEHPEIYLPYELFIVFCNGLIQTFEFQLCYHAIHSYMTISLGNNPQGLLSSAQIRSINHLLIFNCVLIAEGFDNTISILRSIKYIDANTKADFEEELNRMKKHYDDQNKKSAGDNELIGNKINFRFKLLDIIPQKESEMTFIGKVSSILLNKKFIAVIFLHAISIIFMRLYKNLNLGNSRIVSYIIDHPIMKYIDTFLQILLFN